jgi:glycerol-3-phosphate dehydrogenase
MVIAEVMVMNRRYAVLVIGGGAAGVGRADR